MTLSDRRPDISVIIPTHNRPASLLRLLRAFRGSDLAAARFEVIVVADGCSDDTADVARREPLPFVVRVLEQTPGQGPGIARNLGASSAAGELLLFLDDDIEPGPRLLEEHLRAHALAGIPAVAIGPPLPIRSPRADLGSIAAWAWWEGQLGEMGRPGHRFSYNEVFSGNLSIPASLFHSVGGFDPRFSECHEDSELGLRLIRAGARVLFVPDAGGLHHELRDHERLIRRKRAEGRADVRLAEVHPELWPSLRISWAEPSLWHPLGLLRRTALAAPPLAYLLIGGLTLCLPLLEGLRLRGSWRKVQAGVMYGWYWRGVSDAVGGRRGLAELARACRTRSPEPEAPLNLDLAGGLEAAERRLTEATPASANVWLGGIEIGLIPARPGAEPLRGEHLRHCLASELPHALLAAMTTLSAAAHPQAPRLRAPHPRGESAMGGLRLPAVSVVIAAWNAESTLAEALGSLLAQTHGDWEAIVVDDGSSDGTAGIAHRYVALDPRFRVLRQDHQGPAAARNLGVEAARHDWVIFLDADDWLLPSALASLSHAAVARAGVDAVHGGWARVTALGEVEPTEFAPPGEDLFPRFAQVCAFAISCCLFRRAVIDRIGRFDAALITCEDWDFWQRLARSGARFVRVDEKVTHYRMRAGSGGTTTDRLLPDGLEVIRRGHAADSRVRHARYADGAPPAELPAARLWFGSWVAGILIGRGESTAVVLDAVRGDSAPGLSPWDIATSLFRAVPVSQAQGLEAWDQLWPRCVGDVRFFLDALERQSGAWRLSHRAMVILERLTLDVSLASRPGTRGTTLAVDIEVTRPIESIPTPAEVQRLDGRILVSGETLGTIQLPACDGLVSARVLADTIAASFAWPLLGRFFEATRYEELQLAREPGGVSVCLAGVPLGAPIPDSAATSREKLHDHIGWTLFLQEVWGLPGATSESFYEEGGPADSEPAGTSISAWPLVEISAELPVLRSSGTHAWVEVRAGGIPIGRVAVPSDHGLITPARLRAAINTETGLELARVVVREAVLGRPLLGDGLRARLAALADRSARAHSTAAAETVASNAAARLAPDWKTVVSAVAASDSPGLLLARHEPHLVNVPADRRASLPSALLRELLEMAGVVGPPAVQLREAGSGSRVEYLPELLWNGDHESDAERAGDESFASGAHPSRQHDRHYFESLFASGDDPWSYETPYERLKHRQTLDLIPEGRIGKALEVGCAEGRFTRLLAPRVERLIAADLSQIALRRAAESCTAGNVEFRSLDLAADDLPDACDLIVCSEVLYYLMSVESLGLVAAKLARALTPAGHLVLAHGNVLADDPGGPGFDWPFPFGAKVIGETLARLPSLRFLREVRNEAYRIQLFQRRPSPLEAVTTTEPEVSEEAPFDSPAPRVASSLKAAGGAPSPYTNPKGSSTLPILMYHRVTREGPDAAARYRVAPEDLEAQLRYLNEAGFVSVTIYDWLRAAKYRRPLPLRSVLLTFDDGYQDFADVAWPLVRRYGFRALVFLVADLIGRTNEWDADIGPPVRLMDWEQIRRLAAEGVEFGSHSASHRPMTGLDTTEVARDAIRSRLILERGLGRRTPAFAYPYGDSDQIVEHLVGACGFQVGLTCRTARAGFRDSPLALPRIEITGQDDLSAFIAKLGD
jgi:glycosyltransferase involved in cell wall biosynthesis/peptidoglycan/xylan/chitin deacetylase (PgdA/CDA1 family)/2-polyprenyl-3-methyl-5-hydroxy-6-metoxy-1,4-benzoquinol methylase